jgi:superoxide reductase
MKPFSELFQTADWKKEKHVPVIEVAREGENFRLALSVGKEISHPNTTEHHIAWIDAYFLAEGDKVPYHLGRFEFMSHGASTEGPNTSTVYSNPETCLLFRTEKPGTVYAFSYCNIHGLWANSAELEL